MNLLELLADAHLIERGQIPELEVTLSKPDAKVEQELEKAGVKPADLLRVKGDFYGVPTRAIGTTAVLFEILAYVPEESARHYQLAPIGIKDGVLEVGIVDPDNLEARDALTFISSASAAPSWEGSPPSRRPRATA